MAAQIGSIDLSWDASGRVRHDLTSVVSLSAEQVSDILAVSVPMLISGQLGVLRPIYSLSLCDRLIHLLDTGQYVLEPINSALKRAKIRFHSGNTICHTFHPSMGLFANNDSVEQAVRQLCYNYAVHISTQVKAEFLMGLRGALTLSMLYYLTEGLNKQAGLPGFDPVRVSFPAQMAMNEFSHSLYSYWEQGRVPTDVTEALAEVKRQYQHIRQRLNL